MTNTRRQATAIVNRMYVGDAEVEELESKAWHMVAVLPWRRRWAFRARMIINRLVHTYPMMLQRWLWATSVMACVWVIEFLRGESHE